MGRRTTNEWTKISNRKIGFLFFILATNFFIFYLHFFFAKFICHFVQKKRKIFVIAFIIIIIIIWNWPSKLIIIIIINSLKSLTKKKKKFLRFFRGTFSQFDNLKKKFTLTNEWMKNIYSFTPTMTTTTSTTTTTTKKSYFFSQQKLFNTECDYRKLIRNFFFLSLSEFILYINT